MIASQAAVKYGLIAGIGTVAYFLLFYFIKEELLFNPFVYWASLGFYLALMWRALQVEEQAPGERLGFRKALQAAFLVFVIANLIYYLFYYLLFGLIDPELIDLQRQVMRESLEQSGNLLSEEQREQMLESLEGDDLNPTAGKVFFTFVRSLIGGFAAALGMAALKGRG
ncbi:MAG: DUF4199 domain-containing protein [Phaeodactylibacter sp.]|nr:DUF4199 domain-containing protein [Phaeodactylibacter sp.]